MPSSQCPSFRKRKWQLRLRTTQNVVRTRGHGSSSDVNGHSYRSKFSACFFLYFFSFLVTVRLLSSTIVQGAVGTTSGVFVEATTWLFDDFSDKYEGAFERKAVKTLGSVGA